MRRRTWEQEGLVLAVGTGVGRSGGWVVGLGERLWVSGGPWRKLQWRSSNFSSCNLAKDIAWGREMGWSACTSRCNSDVRSDIIN